MMALTGMTGVREIFGLPVILINMSLDLGNLTKSGLIIEGNKLFSEIENEKLDVIRNVMFSLNHLMINHPTS